QNGTEGIYFSEASGTIESNTWEDYRARPLGVYGGEMVARNNSIDGFGYYAASCVEATLEIDETQIENGGAWSYSYDVYVDDSYEATYSDTEVGYALYGYGCTMTVSDTDLGDLDGSAIRARTYGTDDRYELYDVSVSLAGTHDEAGYSAIYFYVDSGSNTVSMDTITIDEAHQEDAVELLSSTDPLEVTIDNLTVLQATDHGIFAQGAGVDLDLRDCLITGVGSETIHALETTIDVVDCELTQADYAGVMLAETTGTVTGNTITDNGQHGMDCTDVTIDDCSDNDLSDNTLGEQTGCPTECGEEAEGDTGDTGSPEDTGDVDTGSD
ncbi:MAG: right-handed parallel beta-helix repeat-containing protein, partial [Myxococcota bacterium]|nr:right-handed parallel beta-helix repeat-containing protein [Myxococcota bacterium]